MALTRKLLKGMGLTDEQVDTIIEAHVESTDSLKDKITELQADSDKAKELVKANEDLQKKVDTLTKNGSDAAKVQAEFDAFKQQIEKEKVDATKGKAVRNLLKASGIQRDTFLDLLMDKIDLDAVEMDGDNIKDSDKFVDNYKKTYGDLFASVSDRGTDQANPPSGNKNGAGKMTREEIMKIEDYDERMKAIDENREAFGFPAKE